MIRGGAQENTLLSVIGQQAQGHQLLLITGPTLGPEGTLIPDAKDAGIDFVEIPELVRAVDPALDVRAYRALRKAIRNFKPDVVHTHSSKAGIIGRLAASHEKVPFICHTIHGLPFHPYQGRFINALYIIAERLAARYCHRIISVCDTMTEKALAAGIGKSEMFCTVYSGMKTDIFLNPDHDYRQQFRNSHNIKSSEIIIGKVARLFELKGHDYLLEAFARIKDQFPNVRLMFVGDGIWRARLERKANHLGLSGRIVWTGLLHPEQVPEAVSAMDLLVHCSMREGLARVLPQALLAGKPVISFDIDGAKEIVINNQTGWLIPPEDINALQQAITEALNDPAKAKIYSQNGREFCRRKFDYRTMNEDLLQIYREGLAKNNGAGK